MDESSLALVELGRELARSGYHFITPTPETHRRVFARREQARDLRDVFGWSRPFARALLPRQLFELLQRAGAVQHEGADRYLSSVRFSSLGDALYAHSAYPTAEPDAVFFGPDTYRFCAFIEQAARPAHTVVDIGCGSGVGGLVAARAAGAERLCLVDVNARALRLAEVNTRLSGRSAQTEVFESDVLSQVQGSLDLIVANPPYMRDEGARVYRDGGGSFGEALSVRILRESLARLAPSGTLLLYTGAAIVEGEDVFFSGIRDLLGTHEHRYVELDPDVFGEELERPGYENVERIAAVALSVTKAP
ncbi:MAG: SAM-dependent methyltransferase [Myxococcaceae bacterium]|nr:SAM-dependent methyltransferase [Myxococcaceae bacterium]